MITYTFTHKHARCLFARATYYACESDFIHLKRQNNENSARPRGTPVYVSLTHTYIQLVLCTHIYTNISRYTQTGWGGISQNIWHREDCHTFKDTHTNAHTPTHAHSHTNTHACRVVSCISKYLGPVVLQTHTHTHTHAQTYTLSFTHTHPQNMYFYFRVSV